MTDVEIKTAFIGAAESPLLRAIAGIIRGHRESSVVQATDPNAGEKATNMALGAVDQCDALMRDLKRRVDDANNITPFPVKPAAQPPPPAVAS